MYSLFYSGGHDLLNHSTILCTCLHALFSTQRQKTTTVFFPVGRIRENKGDCWHTDNSDGFCWSDDMMLVVATLEDQNQRAGCGFGVQISSPPSVFFFSASWPLRYKYAISKPMRKPIVKVLGYVHRDTTPTAFFLHSLHSRHYTPCSAGKKTSTHHKVFNS